MLKIDNLVAHYGAIEALSGVSLHINAGEIVSLIGANGAGKSTLLMTLSGQPKPTSGTITYQGRDLAKLKPYEIAQLHIAHVPEGRRIFAAMTVLENLQLGAQLALPKQFTQNLDYVCNLFPRLKERLTQRGGTLSGGEQQMLAIARALMTEPQLLLLDEPSLGLAPLLVKQIFTAIADINRARGMTIFLVEQNAHHALKLAARGYVMVNGKITLSGSGHELLSNPAVQAAYLEGAVA